MLRLQSGVGRRTQSDLAKLTGWGLCPRQSLLLPLGSVSLCLGYCSELSRARGCTLGPDLQGTDLHR